MKIVILQADDVRPLLRAGHGDYPRMFVELLKDAAPDARFLTHDCRRGRFPARLAQWADGFIVTGSRRGVYDRLRWIEKLSDYLRGLHAAGAPIFGVCFGHQLLAEILGGHAARSDKGWGVGRQEWRIVADAPWMRPRLKTLRLLASHRDQVVKLPPGARRLATSDFCPNAMFSHGKRIAATQGHPEFTPAYSRAILDYRRVVHLPEVYKKGIDSSQKPVHRTQFAEWMVRFFRQH